MAEDDVDKNVVEREAVRLQARVDRHPTCETEALPQPLGVRGGMDLSADKPQPAKHQSPGVVAAEADAGDDNNIQLSGDKPIPDDDGILELVQEDDGDETMEPLNRDFVESDEDVEPASPRVGPATPNLDDRSELALPNAKRSRLSRITAIQNLCKMEQLKSRNAVRDNQTA